MLSTSHRTLLLALLAVAFPLGAQQVTGGPTPSSALPADLIVHNARIYTVDDNHPFVEAMVVRGGRVVFVGHERGAMTFRGTGTRVLDLNGRTVIPGMTDAHVHLQGLGQALRTVDLTGTTSYEQVIERVAARAKETPAGAWVIGRGWDQNDWANTRFPSHDALSRALPDHPVYLVRVDGHAALVNAKAMELARLTAATRDPSGGRIERGAGNAPTGVLVDNAMGLVGGTIPPASRDELKAQVLAAIKESNRWGLTSVHDAGVGRAVIDVYEELAKEGRFDLRNYVMISGDSATLTHFAGRGAQSALHDNRLWIRAIKISIDGALGSRGAALLEPYADEPNHSGLLLVQPAQMRRVAIEALRRGFQVNVHAIGDRGNRVVLDEFQRALDTVPVADHRFRIEHAQILHPDDVPRFAELGVIPSMQASHQTSDMYWAGNRLGQNRLLGAYAWRSLLATGVVIPNGSDFPVEQVNPLISFHASVARQDAKNWPVGGWFPEQRMTREEALRSMTIWAAYAAFQERDMGSLSPGKLADFVVLDQDIMQVPAELILNTNVLSTWVGGKPVYERKFTP
jgi:predicted amidohydrolase YtcJ